MNSPRLVIRLPGNCDLGLATDRPGLDDLLARSTKQMAPRPLIAADANPVGRRRARTLTASSSSEAGALQTARRFSTGLAEEDDREMIERALKLGLTERANRS